MGVLSFFLPLVFFVIEAIRLVNWRSHADSVLDFGLGTNVIVGVMGSGKSSVVDALCFGLFGTFPALNARRVSLEEVIRSVPNPAESATVELFFVWNGKHYRVERWIKRKGSNEARLFVEDALWVGPKPLDVNAAIASLLGMSYDLFARAAYAEQNQLDFFLRLSPAERKVRFDELLDLDRFERARASCGSLMRRLEDRVIERERLIQQTERRLIASPMVALQREMEEVEKRLVASAKSVALLKQEEQRLEEAFSRGLEAERAVRDLERSLAGFVARVSSARRALDQLPKALETGSSGKEVLNAESKANEKVGFLESEVRKQSEVLQAVWSKKAVLESNFSAVFRSRKQLENLSGRCPTCLRPVDASSKALVDVELEGEATRLKEALSQLESEEEKLVRARSLVETDLGKARQALEQARSSVANFREMERLGASRLQWESEWKTAEEEAQKTRARLGEWSFDAEAFRALSDRRSRLLQDLAALVARRAGDERLLESLRAQWALVERERAFVESQSKVVRKNQSDLASLQVLSNALVFMQGELRNVLLENLNAAMAEIFPLVYPYADFLACRLLADERSYELQVCRSDGSWVRVEGLLSGGERASAALSIRLAFSLVLARQLGFVVLDEPTHNLDASAVDHVVSLMSGPLPKWVGQVFVITHHAGLERAATGSLYRVLREKALDGPSRVERLESAFSWQSQEDD